MDIGTIAAITFIVMMGLMVMGHMGKGAMAVIIFILILLALYVFF